VAGQGGLELYHLNRTAPLVYSTSGVAQDDSVAIHSAPVMRFFGNGSTSARERVTVTLQVVPPAAGCPCRLYAGARGRAVALPIPPPGGADVRFSRTLDLAAHSSVTLPLAVRGRAGGIPHLGLNLIEVRIKPL
jgi:hypothetical protein